MNLRGQLTTDAQGEIKFTTIKPAGYPVPVNEVVGDWLRAQGRHNMRPAHLHFLAIKAGYKTQFSQVYDSADANLETDSQFGVTAALVADYVRRAAPCPTHPEIKGEWFELHHQFVLLAGESTLPRAPITGKTDAPRPSQVVLARGA